MAYFTICVPTYNRQDSIGRTLISLREQTFQDFEVLVIDDGSKDNTRAVVESMEMPNLKYIYKENGGKHTAVNKGIELANSKFFMILDSDDVLRKDALQLFYIHCLKIQDNNDYSGVLARSGDFYTKELIGEELPSDIDSLSYIDIHFYTKFKENIYDCVECNKTEIMKNFSFPEDTNTRFVPEAWLFDQIGLNHKLLYINQILKYNEYREDGITKNTQFKEKNIVGYLYHYISRIENIIPGLKSMQECHKKAFRAEIIAWWRYWQAVSIDREHKGPRIQHISLTGFCIRLCMPVLNIIYRTKYREIYKTGR